MFYLSEFCCLCLQNKQIFLKLEDLNGDKSYYDKLKVLLSTDFIRRYLLKNDTLICINCCQYVDDVHNFQSDCKKNIKTMHNYLSQLREFSSVSGQPYVKIERFDLASSSPKRMKRLTDYSVCNYSGDIKIEIFDDNTFDDWNEQGAINDRDEHLNQLNINVFKCNICNEEFRNSVFLAGHKMMHASNEAAKAKRFIKNAKSLQRNADAAMKQQTLESYFIKCDQTRWGNDTLSGNDTLGTDTSGDDTLSESDTLPESNSKLNDSSFVSHSENEMGENENVLRLEIENNIKKIMGGSKERSGESGKRTRGRKPKSWVKTSVGIGKEMVLEKEVSSNEDFDGILILNVDKRTGFGTVQTKDSETIRFEDKNSKENESGVKTNKTLENGFIRSPGDNVTKSGIKTTRSGRIVKPSRYTIGSNEYVGSENELRLNSVIQQLDNEMTDDILNDASKTRKSDLDIGKIRKSLNEILSSPESQNETNKTSGILRLKNVKMKLKNGVFNPNVTEPEDDKKEVEGSTETDYVKKAEDLQKPKETTNVIEKQNINEFNPANVLYQTENNTKMNDSPDKEIVKKTPQTYNTSDTNLKSSERNINDTINSDLVIKNRKLQTNLKNLILKTSDNETRSENETYIKSVIKTRSDLENLINVEPNPLILKISESLPEISVRNSPALQKNLNSDDSIPKTKSLDSILKMNKESRLEPEMNGSDLKINTNTKTKLKTYSNIRTNPNTYKNIGADKNIELETEINKRIDPGVETSTENIDLKDKIIGTVQNLQSGDITDRNTESEDAATRNILGNVTDMVSESVTDGSMRSGDEVDRNVGSDSVVDVSTGSEDDTGRFGGGGVCRIKNKTSTLVIQNVRTENDEGYDENDFYLDGNVCIKNEELDIGEEEIGESLRIKLEDDADLNCMQTLDVKMESDTDDTGTEVNPENFKQESGVIELDISTETVIVSDEIFESSENNNEMNDEIDNDPLNFEQEEYRCDSCDKTCRSAAILMEHKKNHGKKRKASEAKENEPKRIRNDSKSEKPESPKKPDTPKKKTPKKGTSPKKPNICTNRVQLRADTLNAKIKTRFSQLKNTLNRNDVPKYSPQTIKKKPDSSLKKKTLIVNTTRKTYIDPRNLTIPKKKLKDALKNKLPHLPSPPVECEHCDKVFQRPHHLREHIRFRHTKTSPVPVYTSENPRYECELCGATYTASKTLKRHRFKIHKISFKCFICNQMFLNKALLDLHNRKHKEKKSYQCKFCYRPFTRYETLISHMKWHSELS